MQLFISNLYNIENNNIYINDEDIIHQLTKVLRIQVWEYIYLQNKDSNIQNIVRYKLKIAAIQNTNKKWSQIITNIKQIENTPELIQNKSKISVAIPFLNKREKYDRVVQKLSEIWIEEIIFRRAERSIIHELSQNKIERYSKISQEATEQSRWRKTPDIYIVKNIYDHTKNYNNIYIADYNWQKWKDIKIIDNKNIYIIWPEWWLTQNEIDKFVEMWAKKMLLWDNILRSETAAIIWAWLLHNS